MKKTLPNHAMRWSEVKRPIVCLAPMDGVTNSAYRQILRSLNREVFLFSEFTRVDGLVQNEFLRPVWITIPVSIHFSCSSLEILRKNLQWLQGWWKTVESGGGILTWAVLQKKLYNRSMEAH